MSRITITESEPASLSGRASSWLVRWRPLHEPAPRLMAWPNAGMPAGALSRLGSAGFVAFDGVLFDRSELAVDGTATDAARVVAACQRWGEEFVEKLRGVFTLAVWDDETKRLRLARDAMGLRSCFYWWNGDVFLTSPAMDALLAQPEVSRRFNRVVIAEYLQNSFPDHQAGDTFYEEVRRLPPGHVLRLSERSLTISRYWDPVPQGFAWADEGESSNFLPILERAIGRCLAAGADSIALSGGFDSVSIAAVAAGTSVARPPLHALSMRFLGTSYDEGETQIAVARALGMPQVLRVVGDEIRTGRFVEESFVIARGLPSPALSPWVAVYTALLGDAARLGLGRMMMGTGGDEVFGVDLSYGADCLTRLDIRPLWRFFRTIQRASTYPTRRVARAVLWRGALIPTLRRTARVALGHASPRTLEWLVGRLRSARPAWLAPTDRALQMALAERLAPAPSMAIGAGEGAYVRSVRRLLLNPLVMQELDQSHAWARSLGFQIFFPYYDRDLVDLTVRMHPEQLTVGGRLKAPLRRLVRERLPDVPLRARKVDYTQAFHSVFRPGGLSAWRRLGGPRALADLDIVEPRRLNELMERYFAGSGVDPLIPWMVLSAEAWLRARSGQPS